MIDLQVGNDGVTRDFIRSPGLALIRLHHERTLQVREPFTNDLDSSPVARIRSSAGFAVQSRRSDRGLRGSPEWKGRNAVLLTLGLDTSRFDVTSSAHTIDLERAIKQANDRNVAVYSFYAPSVGLTSRSRLAASYGQNSLNRLANDTGGKAFFQGTNGFVTFDSYFEHLRRTLNEPS